MASSGRDFDPRTRAFSDEELKPQPMIKKSRKQVSPHLHNYIVVHVVASEDKFAGYRINWILIEPRVFRDVNEHKRSNVLMLFLSLPLLRPQFVPDDLKDDKYWARRRKNNMAAKRSRDARRMKENQIALRAGFLEKEVNFLTARNSKYCTDYIYRYSCFMRLSETFKDTKSMIRKRTKIKSKFRGLRNRKYNGNKIISNGYVMNCLYQFVELISMLILCNLSFQELKFEIYYSSRS